MKTVLAKTTLLSALLCLVSSTFGAATEGSARLEFTTATTGAKHAPKNVLAVWVTDAHTNFVATLLKQAGKRQKYLGAWNAARGQNAEVDGVTGATLPKHASHTVTWTGRDAKGKTAPDGQYLFFVEFAESNSRGPSLAIPFTKGPAPYGQTAKDQKNFVGIKVSFVPMVGGQGK